MRKGFLSRLRTLRPAAADHNVFVDMLLFDVGVISRQRRFVHNMIQISVELNPFWWRFYNIISIIMWGWFFTITYDRNIDPW